MTRLLLLILAILPVSAFAAEIMCTVPDANVERGLQLCDVLRVRLGVSTAKWSNEACGSEFLRLGMMQVERTVTTEQVTQNAQQTINTAIDNFASTWPPPTPARCGDSTIDTDFGETCDDGNNVNGDGCNDSCTGP